jgi:microcin C transport system substrate-binding protein
LRKAVKLLADAGWRIDSNGGNSALKNDKGETLSVEFLLDQPNFERIALPYKQQLELIGLDIVIRTVDSSQYQRRLQSFDYDVIVGNWPQSLSPGNEQRDFFGSAAADRNGSRNYLGIKNPAVDAIIERLIFSTDRDDLIAASRALDRVLLWNHYVVPMWYIPYDRIARWDRFGRPDKLPDYANGFPSIWWWDEQKAKQVAAAK